MNIGQVHHKRAIWQTVQQILTKFNEVYIQGNNSRVLTNYMNDDALDASFLIVLNHRCSILMLIIGLTIFQFIHLIYINLEQQVEVFFKVLKLARGRIWRAAKAQKLRRRRGGICKLLCSRQRCLIFHLWFKAIKKLASNASSDKMGECRLLTNFNNN